MLSVYIYEKSNQIVQCEKKKVLLLTHIYKNFRMQSCVCLYPREFSPYTYNELTNFKRKVHFIAINVMNAYFENML